MNIKLLWVALLLEPPQTDSRNAGSFASLFNFIRLQYIIWPLPQRRRYMRLYQYETRGQQMAVWLLASEEGKFQLSQRTFSRVETHVAADYKQKFSSRGFAVTTLVAQNGTQSKHAEYIYTLFRRQKSPETSSLTAWQGVSGPRHVQQVAYSICTEGGRSWEANTRSASRDIPRL
jgi:hypothetical protein